MVGKILGCVLILFVFLVCIYPPLRALCLYVVSIPFYRDKCPNFGNYGLFGYIGDFGSGKTYAMTKRIEQLRKEYNNDCYIFTNYGYKYQTGDFVGFESFCQDFDKPVIIAVDELQIFFNARDWKNGDSSLIRCVSQCRKGKGKTILYTSPCYAFADTQVRRMSARVCKMSCLGGRVVTETGLLRNEVQSVEDTQKTAFSFGISKVYLQRKKIRDLYNSFDYVKG